MYIMYIHRLLREKKVMSLVHYKMDSFSQKHFSNFINKLLKSFHLEKYPRHFSKSETNVSELLCPCYHLQIIYFLLSRTCLMFFLLAIITFTT